MTERQKGYVWGWMLATLTVVIVYVLDQFMPPPVTSLGKMAFSLCIGCLCACLYLRSDSGSAP